MPGFAVFQFGSFEFTDGFRKSPARFLSEGIQQLLDDDEVSVWPFFMNLPAT